MTVLSRQSLNVFPSRAVSRKSSFVAYSRGMQIGPVDDKSRPWLALRAGESIREWHERLSRTCWRCGEYILDRKALDRHEAGHQARSRGASEIESTDGVSDRD